MATAILLPPDTRPRPTLPVKRFSLAEYHRLIEIGFLKPSDRLELINGWLVTKMPQNPPHAKVIVKLSKWLMLACPDTFEVRVQLPVTLSDDSEPEPDLVVCNSADSGEHHPYPEQIALVIEVADSTLAQDRGEKLEVYARDKIPQYWIVNVTARVVEVYTKPRNDDLPRYAGRQVFGHGQAIPVTFGRRVLGELPVADILP